MQNRPVDALAVGCASLAELGCPVPGVDELAERGPHLADELAAWSREGDAEADLSRDRDTDPITAALGNLMNRMVPAAFFIGSPLTPWLVLTAARIWTESGPSPALAGTLAHAAFVCDPLRVDYRTAYAVVSRMLTVSDAMGREPDASFVRFVHALSTAAWFEPLPDVLQHARIAHERLVGAGDLYSAGFTWYTSSPIVLDCDSLATHQAEAERGIVFATTTANDQVAQVLRPHRAIGEALSGPEPATPADEDGPRPETAGNPQAEASFHLMSAFIALILGDRPALARHAPEAIARSRFFGSGAVTVLANLVRALSYSDEIRAAPEPERARLLAAFDRHHAWIAARAADAPGNFGHLDSWLRAERAWAVDDFAATVRLFDRAEYDTEGRPRPWHRALLAERRARFLMANGVECAGRIMLHHAVERYRSWGAERKVVALREEFPFLEADVVPQRQEPLVSAQTIDLLAVLRVCQAISSETAVDRLTEQVNDLLCGLTGATAARLVLRDPDTGDWFLPVDADAPLPFTVLRYVERTREPLLVDDAKRDDRFAHDPFLRTLERLALLVVPILTGGEPTAILVLENEVSRGAFGLNRLETVSLLAGQLSVSLNNALLYAALERKVADRTQALAEANAKLEILAATDPLTGLPNRRRLEESLGRRPAAVAMIDIDHFKLYNDRYGHQAGDECLRRVAHVIGANVRESDVVVRYGGEEFAVILDNADEVTALAVAERIRAAVEDLAEPHDAAPRGRVTVSIGVAAGDPATGTAPDDLLGAADACLYAAKAAGRNGVRS
jgi:diguanylate cyclase (GGDEF)-like protein